jgi:hypothetical protein
VQTSLALHFEVLILGLKRIYGFRGTSAASMELPEADSIAHHHHHHQQEAANPAAAFTQSVGALERDSVLQVIFSMLGTKAWAIIAGVNRQWRDLYAHMVERKQTSAAVLMSSLSTYNYAKLCGRHRVNRKEHELIGVYAGLDVVHECVDAVQAIITACAALQSQRPDTMQLLTALSPHIHPGNDCDTMLLCQAALFGQLECLRFLIGTETNCRLSLSDNIYGCILVSQSAAQGGHVPTLQWLQQKRLLHEPLQSSECLCYIAARHEHMDAVIWLHAQGFALGPRACEAAAAVGNAQLLRWLHEHGAQWDAETITEKATEGGGVEVLEFLHEKAVGQWDLVDLTRLLFVAGKYGNLAAAQWLHSLGGALPTQLWDAYECWPHLSTLQWAIETGASWGATVDAVAAGDACEEMVAYMPLDAWVWAHEHDGCPCECIDWQQQ